MLDFTRGATMSKWKSTAQLWNGESAFEENCCHCGRKVFICSSEITKSVVTKKGYVFELAEDPVHVTRELPGLLWGTSKHDFSITRYSKYRVLRDIVDSSFVCPACKKINPLSVFDTDIVENGWAEKISTRDGTDDSRHICCGY